MPAKDVKAYVKRNKNDAADAEAICEAVRRPTMRFVTVKTVEQQGRLMQHRVRDQLMRQRTQLINALCRTWPSSALLLLKAAKASRKCSRSWPMRMTANCREVTLSGTRVGQGMCRHSR